MENIFSAELSFLEDLANDLEGTFSVIAYTGHENDNEYIESAQRELKEKYEKFFDYIIADVFWIKLWPAYSILEEILKFPVKERISWAEEGLALIAEAETIGEDNPLKEYFEQS